VETPSRSLWRQAGEGEREGMQPGLDWSEEKVRIRLLEEEVEEEEGCLGPAKATAAARRMGSHLWHRL